MDICAWGHLATIYLTSEKSLQFSFGNAPDTLPTPTLVYVVES